MLKFEHTMLKSKYTNMPNLKNVSQKITSKVNTQVQTHQITIKAHTFYTIIKKCHIGECQSYYTTHTVI